MNDNVSNHRLCDECKTPTRRSSECELAMHSGDGRRTYVWFSPLGLANHDTAEKTTMKTMLTSRLHLRVCQSHLGELVT